VHRFSNPKARPVLVGEYDAVHGWLPARRKVVLTEAVAYSLLLRDVTMVRVRWRLRTVEYSLNRLRPRLLQQQQQQH
jgi:hypothetical protein